jgi:hypothetical protein
MGQRILNTENLTTTGVQGGLPSRIAVKNGSVCSDVNRLSECGLALLGDSVAFSRDCRGPITFQAGMRVQLFWRKPHESATERISDFRLISGTLGLRATCVWQRFTDFLPCQRSDRAGVIRGRHFAPAIGTGDLPLGPCPFVS